LLFCLAKIVFHLPKEPAGRAFFFREFAGFSASRLGLLAE
jgi:hypothetical protein